MGEKAAAAIKRSEEIAPSTTATLEQEDWTTWDGTMMGRIVEWMTGDKGKDFSITGGEVNRGKREKTWRFPKATVTDDGQVFSRTRCVQ